MRILDIAKRFVMDPKIRFGYMTKLGFYQHMDDKAYIEKSWMVNCGYRLDWEHLRTFNEKIQWLTLYDHNPLYTVLADKYKVREFVSGIIGKEHLIPLLGVWEKAEDVDFNELPNQFVLKCNHNSGTGMCICKDKSTLDIKKVRKGLKKGLKEDYYLRGGREWQYKDIPRRILAEKYMEDESGYELKDYKLFCFSGKVLLIEVDYDREVGHKRSLYTRDWEHIEGEIGYPSGERRFDRPEVLGKMIEIAEQLSVGIIFVRVDLYVVHGKIYFGEMTFHHDGGMGYFNPEELGVELGKLIQITDGGMLG